MRERKEENSQVFQKQEGGTRFEKKTDSAEVKGAQIADEFVSFPREFSWMAQVNVHPSFNT